MRSMDHAEDFIYPLQLGITLIHELTPSSSICVLNGHGSGPDQGWQRRKEGTGNPCQQGVQQTCSSWGFINLETWRSKSSRLWSQTVFSLVGCVTSVCSPALSVALQSHLEDLEMVIPASMTLGSVSTVQSRVGHVNATCEMFNFSTSQFEVNHTES